MKVAVCDVCYYEREGKPMPVNGVKLVPSRYRISFKNGMGERIALDVCTEHQNYFKTCKGFKEAQEKVHKLYGF